MFSTLSLPTGLPAARALRARLRGPLARGLSAMALAQLAIRLSRIATVVVLSRALDPHDYGAAAIVLTVYEFVAIFTRNGIAARVVQATQAELASVAATAHTLIWLVCGTLMLVQAAIALPVAWLYDDARLAWPVGLMGLVYLATPVSAVQAAMMQREGRIGRFAAIGGAQVVVDNLLTAAFAWVGLGLWAIILPKLLVAPIWAIGIRAGHAWRPAPGWRLAGWREVTRFSAGVLGVELLTTAQANMDNLIVGALLGVEALGIYVFAFNAGLGITLGLVNAFAVAVYPHLCAAAGDPALLARRYRESLGLVGAAIVPLVVVQVALAPFYVPLVFGERWNGAVPVMMVIALSALPRPFAVVCSQLLKAAGRPGLEVPWQAALAVLLCLGVLAGTQFGLLGAAAGVLAAQLSVLSVYLLRAPRQVLARRVEVPSPPST